MRVTAYLFQMETYWNHVPLFARREMSNKALAEGLDDGHKKRSTTFRIVVEAYVRWYRFSKD